MTATYADRSDLALIPALKQLALREIDAFFQFDHAAFRGDGEIPLKIRELIAVAVALTTYGAFRSYWITGVIQYDRKAP
jgi:alkylhydroperoxidase/carboxymuconolactone decarboxylase family protein YurZ